MNIEEVSPKLVYEWVRMGLWSLEEFLIWYMGIEVKNFQDGRELE
jgi:hypothetical protein